MKAFKMQPKHWAYIAVLAIVSGCTVQPMGNGGYQLSAPSLGNMLNPSPSTASSANTGGPSADPTFPGTVSYSGQIDGGTAQLQLVKLGTAQYHLDLGAKGTAPNGLISGLGGVSGILTETGGSNVYTMSQADDGHPCYLSVKMSGTQMQIDEDFSAGRPGCMAEHGASLSFDGILYRN